MIVLRSRSLIVPNDEYNLGNDYDTNTATRVFQLDRVMEGIDLGNLMFKLDLTYADGTDDTLALDSEVTDDKINLTWTVTKNQLHVPGTVVVQIRALNVDGNMKWTSNIGAFFVEASLFGSADYTGKLSEIEQFEAAISSEKERVQNEKKRQDAEAEREKAETARKSAETERNEAEAVRKSAETERGKAEAERKSAEDEREEWYNSAKSNFDAAVESGNKAERIANALTETVDADMKAAASSATAAAESASAAAGSANEAKQYSQNWSALDERVKKNTADITTTNNNLSNYDKNNVNSPTIADCNSPGVKEGTLNENSKNTPNTEGLTTATEGHLSTIFPNRGGSWNAQMVLYNGKNPGVFLRGADTAWAKWLALALKSDLDSYYKKTDGALFNGRVSMNVPQNTTKTLTSTAGSFFIAKSAGNNYAGCAYFVIASWSGIHKTYPILENDKVAVIFKNANSDSSVKISATVTTGAVGGEIPFDIYALQ